MSSPAPIIITPVSASDISSITRAIISSFEGDEFFASAFPEIMTAEQKEEYYQYRLRRIDKASQDENMSWFKAADSGTEEVVGVCSWVKPEEGEHEEDDGGEDGQDRNDAGGEGGEEVYSEEERVDMPKFVNMTVFEKYDEALRRMKEEVGLKEREDYWYLATISVIPAYRGRGVGSQMLKHGLTELVDKDGRECYLEASPIGAGLYRRYGFEDRAAAEMMDGSYKIIAMLRPGQGQKRSEMAES